MLSNTHTDTHTHTDQVLQTPHAHVRRGLMTRIALVFSASPSALFTVKFKWSLLWVNGFQKSQLRENIKMTYLNFLSLFKMGHGIAKCKTCFCCSIVKSDVNNLIIGVGVSMMQDQCRNQHSGALKIESSCFGALPKLSLRWALSHLKQKANYI